jgi:membrane-associated phospholipid phosphatase
MPKKISRIFGFVWFLTIIIGLVDLVWAHNINFRIERNSAAQSTLMFFVVIIFAGLFYAIARSPFKALDRKRFYENVSHLFMWVALLAVFTHAGVVFQYLCVTTNLQLVSNSLISFDSALGFNWLEAYRWVTAHNWIHYVFVFAYASGSAQLFVIPIILALTSNSLDYAEFVVQFLVSAIVVIVIAIYLPAESAFVHFGIDDPDTASTVSDYALLRSGAMREFTFASAQGLISFPSLHTILALCFAYSLRHVPFAFPVGVLLNFLMILSTPTQGGHYLSDVLAGIIIGALLIYFIRRFFVGTEYDDRRGVQQGNIEIAATLRQPRGETRNISDLT